MTIRVQNDSGTTVNANAYIDQDYADLYFEDRYVTSWEDYTDDDKEGAIIKATDHIDNKFEIKFGGARLTDDQNTSLPRKNFYDIFNKNVSSSIPDGIKKAVCEYAKAILESDLKELNPNLEYNDTGQNVKSETTKIDGAITKSITYKDDFILNLNRYYPKADDYVKKYLTANASGSNIFFKRG
jgi:hypothetical protein